jgi:putative NIF3 family GTP cyclohydrolase 1 type 2
MQALELNRRLLEWAPWLNPAKTEDRIIIGDPEKEICRCAVTWISSLSACQKALAAGADLLITHEPTFYDKWDKASPDNPEIVQRKRKLIENSGMVVLRLHDTWDSFPDLGVPWAWARFLGLGDNPAQCFAPQPANSVLPDKRSPPTMFRYDISPLPALEFAWQIAAKTALLGEPVVQFIGPPDSAVSRIGIGTGCICSPRMFMELGADCSIVCDDGTSYWRWLQLAEDAGHPVVRVNHGTAEEPGMMTLARHIQELFPELYVQYLPHKPAYVPVGAIWDATKR